MSFLSFLNLLLFQIIEEKMYVDILLVKIFIFRKIEISDADDPLRVLGCDEKGNVQLDNHS